jgi:formate dehydrogenase assembly factor FdhD
MSTSVTQQQPVSSRPSRGFGLAAAGLAVIVALGIGFTLSEDNVGSPTDVRPAHPQVSDSRRVKAEILAQLETVSPGANVEAHKVGNAIVGVESAETFNIEKHRIEMQKAETAWDALAKQAQAYTEMQAQVQKSGGEVEGS